MLYISSVFVTGTVPVFMSRERIDAVKGNSLEEYFFFGGLRNYINDFLMRKYFLFFAEKYV